MSLSFHFQMKHAFVISNVVIKQKKTKMSRPNSECLIYVNYCDCIIEIKKLCHFVCNINKGAIINENDTTKKKTLIGAVVLMWINNNNNKNVKIHYAQVCVFFLILDQKTGDKFSCAMANFLSKLDYH